MSEEVKILLIEDDKEDAFLIEKMLGSVKKENNRFKINHVERFTEGEEQIKDSGADVILLDLTLPDSEFYQTFFKINQLSKSYPIIVMTGLNDNDIAKRALNEGASKYLVKGQFDGEALIGIINEAINKKQTIG